MKQMYLSLQRARMCRARASRAPLPPSSPVVLDALFPQPGLEIGERLISACRPRRINRPRFHRRVVIEETRVLVFVAVDAQQLPVAAVGRIVVVIVVGVVDRQLVHRLWREFPAAARADPRQKPERLLAVAAFASRARIS